MNSRRVGSLAARAPQVSLHIGRLVIDGALSDGASAAELDIVLRQAIAPLLAGHARPLGPAPQGAVAAMQAAADALAVRLRPTLAEATRS